jgi:L-lysine 2,3-aminomutase
MTSSGTIVHRPFRVFGTRNLEQIEGFRALDASRRLDIEAVAQVLPFRVNDYVLDELIDWSRVPDDPMFQLTFPQEGMLPPGTLRRIRDLLVRRVPRERLLQEVRAVQGNMNPHPAGQLDLNVPRLDGEPVPGLQHKYRETVLFFPSAGQTCHAYCTYCFRWAQFVGIEELKFANNDAQQLVEYLRAHPEVSDVLITGGDPLVMRTRVLRRYVEPLLALDHITSIRIGTKAVAYWP